MSQSRRAMILGTSVAQDLRSALRSGVSFPYPRSVARMNSKSEMAPMAGVLAGMHFRLGALLS
jgi:hypothetical protein